MTNQKTPVQGGATEEQIEAAAISFSCATEEDWWDQEETFREVTRIEVRRAFEAAARVTQSASASAHPADERHDAEERLARIQRLLGPLRNRIDEYGAVPLRHAVMSTLEALSGRSAEECEGLSVNDHCCQHPKCPGGGLCCCESEDHAATEGRKVPHTGPGHGAGDAGFCEGCAAEREDHAATVTGDRELVASVLREHRPSRWRSFNNDTIVYRCCGQDFGRLAGKPRKSDRDPMEQWEEHAAQVLVDRLRGEG